MKNDVLKKINEFLNRRDGNQSLNESNDDLYTLKTSKSGSKPVYVLILTQKGWEKVESLFNDFKSGNVATAKDSKIKNIKSKGYVFNLISQRTKLSKDDYLYRISGESGDYSIGLPPSYMNMKYNKMKPSKEILNNFVKQYLDK